MLKYIIYIAGRPSWRSPHYTGVCRTGQVVRPVSSHYNVWSPRGTITPFRSSRGCPCPLLSPERWRLKRAGPPVGVRYKHLPFYSALCLSDTALFVPPPHQQTCPLNINYTRRLSLLPLHLPTLRCLYGTTVSGVERIKFISVLCYLRHIHTDMLIHCSIHPITPV